MFRVYVLEKSELFWKQNETSLLKLVKVHKKNVLS